MVGSVDRAAVVAKVDRDAGFAPRYLFMTIMSAGIAVLGLLLSSPAVIIGAMLISPLMGPIIGLGFAFAIFDWREVRRSLLALGLGSAAAVAFTAAVVGISPLSEVTPEILARTRPSLFDLLVAVFSALAGAYAVIRGRGETIVGVAIATALMPPLAVVGFGMATGNMPVLSGAFALFITNLIAIALSATVMARLYGFGSGLSPNQTRLQTLALVAVIAALAVPLGLALNQIAWEARVGGRVRAALQQRFGADASISQLEMSFDARPITARAVVLTPHFDPRADAALAASIAEALGRPVTLDLAQVVVGQDLTPIQQAQAAMAGAQARAAGESAQAAAIRSELAAVTGVAPEQVLVDLAQRRAFVRAAPAASALRQAEARVAALHTGWRIRIEPASAPVVRIPFAPGESALPADSPALADAVWALRRSGAAAASVTGRVASRGDAAGRSPRALAAARAEAVAAALRAAGIAAQPAADPPGPVQRAAEVERGVAPFRSVEVRALPPQLPQQP